jgi:hypothetical protein
MWLYAIKNRLIDENLTRIEIHGILLGSILSPLVFLLSILVSIIDLPIEYYIWIVLIPTKSNTTIHTSWVTKNCVF